MHAILPIAGKGSSGWEYAHVPVLGPIIGASLAGVTVNVVGI
jgi:glycerol uptake facilitator protein